MARHPAGTRHGASGPVQNKIYIIAGLVVLAVIAAVIFGFNPFRRDDNATGPDPNGLTALDANAFDAVGPEVNEIEVPGPEYAVDNEPDTNSAEVVPDVTMMTESKAAELIAEAMGLLRGSPRRIIEARDKLNEALQMNLTDQQRSVVKAQMTELAEQWLFSKTFFPQDRLCSSYKVQTGDLLSNIGEQHQVPYEILMEINNIRRPELLGAGTRIKVIHGPFHAKVYRSTFTMDVYLQNIYVRSYPVGLGAAGRQTPLGLWHIKPGGKIPHALYTDPDSGKVIHPEDPEYPLGSRWMALQGLDENTKKESGFGIHGTKDPESIGKAVSRGCIRLHNGDAIQVYNMLVASHSLIKIKE